MRPELGTILNACNPYRKKGKVQVLRTCLYLSINTAVGPIKITGGSAYNSPTSSHKVISWNYCMILYPILFFFFFSSGKGKELFNMKCPYSFNSSKVLV